MANAAAQEPDAAQDQRYDPYIVKAACWLEDHHADKNTEMLTLAYWAKGHADGSHWAAVAQDGSIVGEADPVRDHSGNIVGYCTTPETSERYHLDLNTAADLAIGEIQRAVGMNVAWAHSDDLSGPAGPIEMDRYERYMDRWKQSLEQQPTPHECGRARREMQGLAAPVELPPHTLSTWFRSIIGLLRKFRGKLRP